MGKQICPHDGGEPDLQLVGQSPQDWMTVEGETGLTGMSLTDTEDAEKIRDVHLHLSVRTLRAENICMFDIFSIYSQGLVQPGPVWSSLLWSGSVSAPVSRAVSHDMVHSPGSGPVFDPVSMNWSSIHGLIQCPCSGPVFMVSSTLHGLVQSLVQSP